MGAENPASNGREMIDDFRLPGSRPWRRIGGHLIKGERRIQMVYEFDNCESALSKGEAPAVVVQVVPGNPHWTWVGTDSSSPLH